MRELVCTPESRTRTRVTRKIGRSTRSRGAHRKHNNRVRGVYERPFRLTLCVRPTAHSGDFGCGKRPRATRNTTYIVLFANGSAVRPSATVFRRSFSFFVFPLRSTPFDSLNKLPARFRFPRFSFLFYSFYFENDRVGFSPRQVRSAVSPSDNKRAGRRGLPANVSIRETS